MDAQKRYKVFVINSFGQSEGDSRQDHAKETR